jgi:hypothetical protein
MGVVFNRNTFGGSRFALLAVFCCGRGAGFLLVGKSVVGAEGIVIDVAGLAPAISWIRGGKDTILGKALLAAGWPVTFKSSEYYSRLRAY